MSRYDLGAPGEEEFEPGSDRSVLRNKLGLKSPHDVNYMEAALLAIAQDRSYRQIETDTHITVLLVRNLHRSWLGSLSDFAGEIRTVDLAKDNVRFAPAAYIEGSLLELGEVFAANTPCEGMPWGRCSECHEKVSKASKTGSPDFKLTPGKHRSYRIQFLIRDLLRGLDFMPRCDKASVRHVSVACARNARAGLGGTLK